VCVFIAFYMVASTSLSHHLRCFLFFISADIKAQVSGLGLLRRGLGFSGLAPCTA
jgi:hypothetical protein